MASESPPNLDTTSLWDKFASVGAGAIGEAEQVLLVTLGFMASALVYAVVLYILYNGFISVGGLLLPLFRNTRLGRFVAKQTAQVEPERLVRDVFSSLGYNAQEIEKLRLANTRRHYLTMGITEPEVKRRLLSILSSNVVSFDVEIKYGNSTPSQSRFYIDTMSASLNPEGLIDMTEIMLYLLSRRTQDAPPIDFVLAPKSGNVLLAQSVAKNLSVRCIYRKSANNNSRARFASTGIDREGTNFKVVNLEGFEQVKSYALACGRPLYGVCLDCNCSGGGEMVNTVEEFNRVADTMPDLFRKVSEGFILYRPDQSEIKSRCADGSPITLTRYFDLTEKQKEILSSKPNDAKIAKLAEQVGTANGSS